MNRMVFIMLVLSALTITACTGGLSSDTLHVEVTDFAFAPNQYTVTAGSHVEVEIDVKGIVEHDFMIMKLGADVGEHFDEGDVPNIYWQVKIQPGEIHTATLTAPLEPGTYQIVCGMAGHLEAGMIGTLIVIEPSTK